MYSPDEGHSLLLAQRPLLAFDEAEDFDIQKQQIHRKLEELLGDMPERVELDPVVEYQKEFDTYHGVTFGHEYFVGLAYLGAIESILFVRTLLNVSG